MFLIQFKEKWDNRKTVLQNYTAIGLNLDPNKDISTKTEEPEVLKSKSSKKNVKEEIEKFDFDSIGEEVKKPVRNEYIYKYDFCILIKF